MKENKKKQLIEMKIRFKISNKYTAPDGVKGRKSCKISNFLVRAPCKNAKEGAESDLKLNFFVTRHVQKRDVNWQRDTRNKVESKRNYITVDDIAHSLLSFFFLRLNL